MFYICIFKKEMSFRVILVCSKHLLLLWANELRILYCDLYSLPQFSNCWSLAVLWKAVVVTTTQPDLLRPQSNGASLTCNVTSSGVDVDSELVSLHYTCLSRLVTWEAASVFHFHPSKYSVSALIWDSLVAWGGDTENRMSIAEACLSPFRPLNCCLSTQCALLSGPLATVLCLIRVLCLLFQSVHKLCS